jgi:hypothetical protein
MEKTWGIYVPLVVGIVLAVVGLLGLGTGFLPHTFAQVLIVLAELCGLLVLCTLSLRIPLKSSR